MPISRTLTVMTALIAVVAASIVGYFALRPPVALLRNVEFSKIQISPNADGIDDLVTIRYTLARPASISIYLENDAQERYYFRDSQPRIAGEYEVLFSGIVDGFVLPGETIPGTVERRLIPNERYIWSIEAVEENGNVARKTGTLDIVDGDIALPIISAFEIHPKTFTPNQDGIHDRVSVNVYLDKAARLQVYLQDDTGNQYFLPEREKGREPGERGNHEFDYDGGVDQGMEPPPDGTYTVFAVAQDDEGQRTVRQDTLTIADGGLPRAEIMAQVSGPSVYFTTASYNNAYFSDINTVGDKIAKPEGLKSMLQTITMVQGDLLIFRLTVYNYGSASIRTAGPFPGTVYDFDQRAASLGQYEESGAWRVGINCDTAYSDFPWRWALAPQDELEAVYDELTNETYYYMQPGQRAEVWGAVRMTEILKARNPQDCWAGLIHEDVGIPAFQSRVGAREIELVLPPISGN